MGVRIENDRLVFSAEPVSKPASSPKKDDLLRCESVEEFITKLASALPAPGGGGSAALNAAQGYALASMVCNLTIGKKKFAKFEEELKEIREKCGSDADRMLDLIDLDEEYFLPLSKAYSLPSETQQEKEAKDRIMQEALATACLVPIETLHASFEAIKMLPRLMKISSRLVISDIGVSAECFRAAIESAKFNVLINVNMMKDAPIKEELLTLLKAADREYMRYYQEVKEYVIEAITLG